MSTSRTPTQFTGTTTTSSTTNTSPDSCQQQLAASQNLFRSHSEHVIAMYADHQEKAEALAYAVVEALTQPSPSTEYALRLAELLYEHLADLDNHACARHLLLGEVSA